MCGCNIEHLSIIGILKAGEEIITTSEFVNETIKSNIDHSFIKWFNFENKDETINSCKIVIKPTKNVPNSYQE